MEERLLLSKYQCATRKPLRTRGQQMGEIVVTMNHQHIEPPGVHAADDVEVGQGEEAAVDRSSIRLAKEHAPVPRKGIDVPGYWLAVPRIVRPNAAARCKDRSEIHPRNRAQPSIERRLV